MPSPHSYYSYLKIYNGSVGESPRKGAFYIPKHGEALTRIAKQAYGFVTSTLAGVQMINRSAWNRNAAKQGAFKYRVTSTSCKSKMANPDNALTTQGYNKGAWLALCPPYPLFWIPAKAGQMPEDLAPPDAPPGPPGATFKAPPKSRGGRVTTKKRAGVKTTRQSPGPGTQSPYYQGQGTSGSRKTALAGVGSPWMLLALALLAAGGYVWYRRRNKKK